LYRQVLAVRLATRRLFQSKLVRILANFRESESKYAFTTAHSGGGVTVNLIFKHIQSKIKVQFSFRLFATSFMPFRRFFTQR